MRVVVIGGTGHTGTYLIPRLIEAGYEVSVVSRQQKRRYEPTKALGSAPWERVTWIEMDRAKAEATGNFGARIAELEPNIVIDMICYQPESARQLVDASRGRIQLFIHCGTIWATGPTAQVPSRESDPMRPICEYGRQKAAIETYLLGEARRTGFPAVVMRPGHIVGQGWIPVNPAANFNPKVYTDLAQGKGLSLPNLGMETLHHVHADDVARAFLCAMARWNAAVGESFNVTSASALTLRGYAEAVADWFGKPASLRFLPWDEWQKSVSRDDAKCTWDHITHSSNCSIEKAQRILSYHPRFSSLEAVKDSVTWLIQNGKVEV